MQNSKIFEEFYYWLEGVQEDTPLPYECKVLCFGWDAKNNMFFSASEYVPKIIEPCEFYPLEAQSFYCKELEDLSTKELELIYVKLIINFAKICSNIFNVEIICYGKEFSSPNIIMVN